ncbi:class I SAM-dependent methyltransferase [Halalkalibacter urbisdiaboli]|uniref:class I SAM-dependent methyltransferase n=1 Tax=Halalkalibacter urbisdiaboli TaxID=1960589 RepID=UPI001FDA1A6B|nr:class I SAM-dependent methyltransferase [Halalkalibacter urbisdiaboli]
MTMKKMEASDFDSLVGFFDAMAQTPWLSHVHDELKAMSGSWLNKDVLDVGCGTGRLLARGVNEARSLTGVDLSKEMVKATTSLLDAKAGGIKTNVAVADAYGLPFDDESFDSSMSTCVMFLLPEPERGLRELFRVTRVNGVICMLNPTPKMNPKAASDYAKRHQITGFEERALLSWSTISTTRHRYDKQSFSDLLIKVGAANVEHKAVLDDLALITVARK